MAALPPGSAMSDNFSRRDCLKYLGASAAVGWTLGGDVSRVATAAEGDTVRPSLHLASFRCDVTPPLGHSCCGGWITPVQAVDDSLEAIGLVLLGAGPPIVICAVDWTGLLNDAHHQWRQALAEAAASTALRATLAAASTSPRARSVCRAASSRATSRR